MPKSDVTFTDSGKKHPVKDKRPMCHQWSTLTWKPPKVMPSEGTCCGIPSPKCLLWTSQ